MKIKLMLLAACAMLLNFACKKNETTEDPKPNPTPTTVKLLVKTTSSNGAVTTYNYDSKKRLTSVVAGSSETTYSYNDRDELLIKTTGVFANRTEYIPEYGDGGKVRSVTMKVYKNGNVDTEKKYTYEYLANGSISKIHQYYGSILEITFSMDYSGENCTKNTSDDPTFGSYTEYNYDDKKTAFERLTDRFYVRMPLGPFPAHNILNQKTTFTWAANPPAPQTSTTAYTYDAEGYPLTATVGSTVTTYTYANL